MDSLTRKRRRQHVAIGGSLAALAGVILIAILPRGGTNSPETDAANAIVLSVSADPYRNRTPAERENLRRQWQALSPETREGVFSEIARARLEEFRRQTADLTPAERQRRIADAVRALRTSRERLPEAERERLRQRVNSPEGREMVSRMMGFYHNELTARERADLDPLVQEWLWQLQRATGGR